MKLEQGTSVGQTGYHLAQDSQQMFKRFQEFRDLIHVLDRYTQKSTGQDFPVLTRSDQIVSSTLLSSTLASIPVFSVDYLLVQPEVLDAARGWFNEQQFPLRKDREGEADGKV